MKTHRSTGGDGGQQYSTQPSPGCSYQQGGDEDSGGHRQTVGPTRQEEISQSKQTQRQRVVRSLNRGRDDWWRNHMIFKNGSITLALHCVKGFTWLVVEETTNASLRSVKEGCCHGVIFPICTEQLGKTENKTEITRQRHVSAPDVWFREWLY